MPARSDAGALAALPGQQVRWALAQLVAGALLAATTAWLVLPELALAFALGCGAAFASPARRWTIPVVITGTVAAGLVFQWMGWPAVIGSGAAAGALATWTLPHRTDALDVVHGALGTLIGSSLGLWAADGIPLWAGAPAWVAPLVICGLTGALAAQGLLPAAIRFDHFPDVPTRSEIFQALREPYRPPALRAIDLFHGARRPPEPATRRGLAEVARWVFELQRGLQTLDDDLENIDPEQIAGRIADAEAGTTDDAFTRERRLATAAHLRRLLDHRATILVERGRTQALAEYALAFLEEARAGLAIAQAIPGETVPERLPEVLGRLRGQAQSGLARRATAREIQPL